MTWDGLAGASYERGFKGTVGGLEALTKVPVANDKAPELTPYKSLQPDRLKITGEAAAVGVAAVALGDIHLRFTWQAWHFVTSTFTLCGRRGTS